MLRVIPYGRSYRRNGNREDFYDVVNRFFETGFTPAAASKGRDFPVDVQETDAQYVIEAEVPGVQKEEINLHLNNDELSIFVQRDESKEEEKDNYVRRERQICSMERRFLLPDASKEGVVAELENGILKIVVPKHVEQNESHKIEIQ